MQQSTNCPPKVKAAMDKTRCFMQHGEQPRKLTKRAKQGIVRNNFVICADYETRATKRRQNNRSAN